MKKLNNQIAEILENFDFEKVVTMMRAVNWKWYNVGIPGTNDLKETATFLLKEVWEKWNNGEDVVSVGTGGFKASIDDEGNLMIEFIAETWHSI